MTWWDNPLVWFGWAFVIGGWLWWQDRRRRQHRERVRLANHQLARDSGEAERVGACKACQRMQTLWRENPQLTVEQVAATIDSQIELGVCPDHRGCGGAPGRPTAPGPRPAPPPRALKQPAVRLSRPSPTARVRA